MASREGCIRALNKLAGGVNSGIIPGVSVDTYILRIFNIRNIEYIIEDGDTRVKARYHLGNMTTVSIQSVCLQLEVILPVVFS